jgi:hypothetical protein
MPDPRLTHLLVHPGSTCTFDLVGSDPVVSLLDSGAYWDPALENWCCEYVDASPPDVPQSSTIAAAALKITLSCKFEGCMAVIRANDRQQMRNLYSWHFRDAHRLAASRRRNEQKLCMWEGCLCRIRRYNRCYGRTGAAHPAHVVDLLTHIFQAHLRDF